jgi:hypothetical protein
MIPSLHSRFFLLNPTPCTDIRRGPVQSYTLWSRFVIAFTFTDLVEATKSVTAANEAVLRMRTTGEAVAKGEIHSQFRREITGGFIDPVSIHHERRLVTSESC